MKICKTNCDLELIEEVGDYPGSILYVNHNYINRPTGIFDQLIVDAQYKGCDTVFPGLIDYFVLLIFNIEYLRIPINRLINQHLPG